MATTPSITGRHSQPSRSTLKQMFYSYSGINLVSRGAFQALRLGMQRDKDRCGQVRTPLVESKRGICFNLEISKSSPGDQSQRRIYWRFGGGRSSWAITHLFFIYYENRAEMTPRPCIKSRFGENSKHHGLLPNSQISNFCKQLHVCSYYCIVPYFLYFGGFVARAGGNWLYRLGV